MEDIELKRKGSHRENKGASPRQSLDHTGRGQESCFKPLDVCFALAPFSLCLDDHSIPLGRGYQKRSGESASYQTGLGLERPEPIPKQALTSHVSFNPYDGISEPDEISEADGTSEVGGTSEPDGNSALPFNDRSLSPTSEDCVIIFNDTDVEYTLSHDFVVVEATSIMGDT